MRTWGPMFTVRFGIPPYRLGLLSVPQMVDHVEYLMEGGQDG